MPVAKLDPPDLPPRLPTDEEATSSCTSFVACILHVPVVNTTTSGRDRSSSRSSNNTTINPSLSIEREGISANSTEIVCSSTHTDSPPSFSSPAIAFLPPQAQLLLSNERRAEDNEDDSTCISRQATALAAAMKREEEDGDIIAAWDAVAEEDEKEEAATNAMKEDEKEEEEEEKEKEEDEASVKSSEGSSAADSDEDGSEGLMDVGTQQSLGLTDDVEFSPDTVALPEGTCEECERDMSVWVCEACEMKMCDMCFDVLHRKGKRALHPKRPREGETGRATSSNSNGNGALSIPPAIPLTSTRTTSTSSTNSSGSTGSQGHVKKTSSFPTFAFWSSASSSSSPPPAPLHPSQAPPLGSSQPMRERALYIPLRLSYEQRKTLRLVQATLTACDYTARVDRVFKSGPHREQAQLKQITGVLQALALSDDYPRGRGLVVEKEYEQFEDFFQHCFEVARRHKIMNPEKMRGEYGKLAYLLQDALSPSLRRHLNIRVSGSLNTVYSLLEEKDGLKLLDDPLIHFATQEILPDKSKSRGQIQQEIKKKERAIETFVRAYASPSLSGDEIRLCLYSICDNNSFLNSNRLPIDKTIALLLQYFSPSKVESGYSLSILQGQDGARLTHSHERQFNFALQSLTLWREITDDMFRLWCFAEEDLLSWTSGSPPYLLRDTGQGLHRVQQCPRTFHAMQDILHKTQRRVGSWVGSSVIHLGDHNVPNALMFIDKYTQVPRILAPIVQCLEQLERIDSEDEGVKNLIKQSFGGLEKLKKDILYDFFKTAFDGSGGDNFFDAGSCIDGRLTSAWHWCSQLPSKPFYPFFKLTGFSSFDGGLGSGG